MGAAVIALELNPYDVPAWGWVAAVVLALALSWVRFRIGRR